MLRTLSILRTLSRVHNLVFWKFNFIKMYRRTWLVHLSADVDNHCVWGGECVCEVSYVLLLNWARTITIVFKLNYIIYARQLVCRQQKIICAKSKYLTAVNIHFCLNEYFNFQSTPIKKSVCHKSQEQKQKNVKSISTPFLFNDKNIKEMSDSSRETWKL